MSKFQIVITKFTQIDNPHSNHFRLCARYSQNPISHNGSTRINAQNYLFFDRLYHSITSISVGNPIALSLNVFDNSSFSFTPCSKCQRCNTPLLSTSHCKE